MQESRPRSSGSGEAHGTSSEPADATSSEEPTQGEAEFEIPLGVPVGDDEMRRLKEAARNLEQPEEGEDADEAEAAQDDPQGDARDESHDEHDREQSGPEEDG